MRRAILLVVYIHNLFIDHYYVRCQSFTLLRALPWQDARIGCRSIGADLVMIKDNAKWTAVSNFLSTYNPPPSEFWFGLQWNPETHKFVLVDCEELGQYHNWEATDNPEPNCMTNTEITHPVCPTVYGEDCVRMRDSLWKTSGCHNKYQVICEKGKSLPLTCQEAMINATDANHTTNSSPTSTSTTDQTQMSNSNPTSTSTANHTQTSTKELSETTEACVFVCPGDPQTTTSRIAKRNTTVPTTVIFKINKKKTMLTSEPTRVHMTGDCHLR